MNKKILALALAIVFIATAFTACKNTPELTEINGKEYPLATNADGETIINEDNQIAVLVTDENDEVITYENGEDQTHWMQISGPVVVEDSVLTGEYTLNAPSGWEANSNGRVVKKNTNDDCYIHFVTNSKVSKHGSFEKYIESIDAQNDEVEVAFEAQGYNVETEKASASIAGNTLNCVVRKYMVTDSTGNIIQYAENYYFVSGNDIHSINYVCENGEGYDESFNFAQFLSSGFEFHADSDE